MFTAIRKGQLGADYPELSEAIISDTDNLLIIMADEKRETMRKIMEAPGVSQAYEPTPAEINAARERIRAFYYARRSDPLNFKWQVSEAAEDKAAWLAERAAIKDEWPDVMGE